MSQKQGFVYILTNARKTVLYTGMTSELYSRVWHHKKGEGSNFTKRYHCNGWYTMKFSKGLKKQ